MNSLLGELKKFGSAKIQEELKKHTTIKIGGKAQYFVNISNIEKLVGLLNFLTGEGISYFILGGGSNVIFPDYDFEKVVIKINIEEIKVKNNKITAQAGVLLSKLVEVASQNNLTGLEWATGIPGTVGGAVRGNAGAMGYSVASALSSVTIWQDGEVLIINNQECEFSYRESVIKNRGGVVLEAEFNLNQAEPLEILKKVQEYFLSRQNKYPDKPSAGSFFKNIELEKWNNSLDELPDIFKQRKMIPVGWITEKLSLKGLKIGDAELSEQHGNFIINLGQAKQGDVLKLVEKIKEEVYNNFRIDLESEVEIVS